MSLEINLERTAEFEKWLYSDESRASWHCLSMAYRAAQQLWEGEIKPVQAEVERKQIVLDIQTEENSKLVAQIHKLHAQVLALQSWEVDAKRYRWLRDGNAYAPEEEMVRGGADLDKLCDESMQPQPLPGGMKTWQHEDTGRMCEMETSPGPRWFSVSAQKLSVEQSIAESVIYDESYNWCPQCSHPRGACVCAAQTDTQPLAGSDTTAFCVNKGCKTPDECRKACFCMDAWGCSSAKLGGEPI